jgi:hypothetical protein
MCNNMQHASTRLVTLQRVSAALPPHAAVPQHCCSAWLTPHLLPAARRPVCRPPLSTSGAAPPPSPWPACRLAAWPPLPCRWLCSSPACTSLTTTAPACTLRSCRWSRAGGARPWRCGWTACSVERGGSGVVIMTVMLVYRRRAACGSKGSSPSISQCCLCCCACCAKRTVSSSPAGLHDTEVV